MIGRSLVLLLVVAGTVILCWASPAPSAHAEAGVVMSLPQRIGRYVGLPQKPDKVELEKLPSDTQFAKMTYVTATQDPEERDVAHVSVVLSGAESRSIHRPEVCLTGQGWIIESAAVVPVEISPGRRLDVRDLSLIGHFPDVSGRVRTLRAHYVYWFVGKDFSTPSHFERIWHSTCDAVLHNVNHRWAYASILASVTEDMEPRSSGERKRTNEQTQRLIYWLVQHLVPQIHKEYLSPTLSVND